MNPGAPTGMCSRRNAAARVLDRDGWRSPIFFRVQRPSGGCRTPRAFRGMRNRERLQCPHPSHVLFFCVATLVLGDIHVAENESFEQPDASDRAIIRHTHPAKKRGVRHPQRGIVHKRQNHNGE